MFRYLTSYQQHPSYSYLQIHSRYSRATSKDINLGTGTAVATNCFIGNNTGATPSLVAGTPNASGSYVGTGASPLNPWLLPLADNEGRSMTCALLTNSLAIDHGMNPLDLPWDQRGAPYTRIFGSACDIGAFEYRPPPPTGGVLSVM